MNNITNKRETIAYDIDINYAKKKNRTEIYGSSRT